MNWAQAMDIGLKLLGVAGLVLLNAFFVAAELAFVRIRDTQLESLAARGHRRAKKARHVVAHIDSYIGATQFGITLASMALGVLVEPVFSAVLEPVFQLFHLTNEHTQHTIAIGFGFFVNCFLLIIAGELVPKAIAIRRNPNYISIEAEYYERLQFPMYSREVLLRPHAEGSY